MLALSLTAFAVVCRLVPLPMADIVVYRAEGVAAATGGDLYGFTVTKWHLPATYPPFAALVFLPTTWLTVGALKAASVVANTALLALLIHLSYKVAHHRPGRPGPRTGSPRQARTQRIPRTPRTPRTLSMVLAATALGLWLEPVFQTFAFGQVNLALACLVLWDFSRPDGARFKGLAIGIAAGIKLTPALFAVYLLITGRIRAAFTALAGFLLSVLLGLLVLPDASVEFWTRRMFETGRIGKVWIVDNQSLQGALARLLHTPAPGAVWPAVALLTAVAGLIVAREVHRRRGLDSWGLLCTAVTAVLVSPISWSHHWVWCVPLLVTLGAYTRRVRWRRALLVAVAVAFTARSMWILPHLGFRALHLPWWQQPLASPYVVLGPAVLAAVAWWTWRRPVRTVRPATSPARRVPESAVPRPVPRPRPDHELST
ncbi:glycosyltransferase 87 family protein [Streptomyces sp. MST-110588]|uniref:glycosyltransferase 87 family protein n=1 Tax=Streptomyces sp. MST-110588 TaxID=2833628 RepID=UPI0032423E47